jgi:hypothetical protein
VRQTDTITSINQEKIYPFQLIEVSEDRNNQLQITVTYDDPETVRKTSEFIKQYLQDQYVLSDSEVLTSNIYQISLSNIEKIEIQPSVNRTLVNITFGLLLGLSLPILFFSLVIYRDRSIFHPEQLALLFGRNPDFVISKFPDDLLPLPLLDGPLAEQAKYLEEIFNDIYNQNKLVDTISIYSTENLKESVVLSLALAELFSVKSKINIAIVDNSDNKLEDIIADNFITDEIDNKNSLYFKELNINSISKISYVNTSKDNSHNNLANFLNQLSNQADLTIVIEKPLSDTPVFYKNDLKNSHNILLLKAYETDIKFLSQLNYRYDFSDFSLVLTNVESNDLNRWKFFSSKIL